jgi:NAD(P)-dependent dehydrogenase (short-subunit alcohol dehydrogenase family)
LFALVRNVVGTGITRCKVAIVTGAASGIGRATALLFEARGAQVIAEDINPAVEELAKSNEHILPFVGDVASEDSAKRVVALAIERFGKLDILVNNAATIKSTFWIFRWRNGTTFSP